LVGELGLEDSEESSPSKARFINVNVMVVQIISIAGGDNQTLQCTSLASNVCVCLTTVK
jgi:hypothetical protein